jgi:hypothetical protein
MAEHNMSYNNIDNSDMAFVYNFGVPPISDLPRPPWLAKKQFFQTAFASDKGFYLWCRSGVIFYICMCIDRKQPVGTIFISDEQNYEVQIPREKLAATYIHLYNSWFHTEFMSDAGVEMRCKFVALTCRHYDNNIEFIPGLVHAIEMARETCMKTGRTQAALKYLQGTRASWLSLVNNLREPRKDPPFNRMFLHDLFPEQNAVPILHNLGSVHRRGDAVFSKFCLLGLQPNLSCLNKATDME